jgi:WD40 repeat protein
MLQLHGHKKDVRAVAFAPDGRLVSGGGDQTVRVWAPVTGACVAVVRAKAPVYAVAAAPDGKTFAFAGRYAPRAEANFVSLCDWAGSSVGRFELRTEGPVARRNAATGGIEVGVGPVPRSIWALSFSASGRYLAAACRVPGGGNIPDGGGGYCWRFTGPTEGWPLNERDAYSLAFAPGGEQLGVTRASAVSFLDGPRGPVVTSYPLSASWSAALAFVPGSAPRKDPPTRSDTVNGPPGPAGGSALAVVASNSFFYLVCPWQQEKPVRLKSAIRAITALAVSPDGQTVLVGGRPGLIEVYDTASRVKKTTYEFGLGGVHALAYAPDGLTYAAAGDKGLVVCDIAG